MSDDTDDPPATHKSESRSVLAKINSSLAKVKILSVKFVVVICIGAVVGYVGYIGFDEIKKSSGTCESYLSLFVQFAGLPHSGSQAGLAKCVSVESNAFIGWDFLLIFGYSLLSYIIIAVGWPRYQAKKLKAVVGLVRFLPVAVAVADIVENVISLIFVKCNGSCEVSGQVGSWHLGSWQLGPWPLGPWFVTFFASLKWVLAAVLFVVCVMSLAVIFSRRGVQPPGGRPPSSPAKVKSLGDPESLSSRHKRGLCLSGGGIRATGFALGALSSLEAEKAPGHDKPIMDTVNKLSAVSGGSWAGTAWVLDRAAEGGHRQGDTRTTARRIHDRLLGQPDPPDQKTSPAPLPFFAPVRYLLNGRGAVGGPVLWVLICIVSTLFTIAAVTYIPAWLLGKILTLPFLFPQFSGATAGTSIDLDWHNPGVFVIILGLLMSFARAEWMWKACVGVIGVGVGIFLYTGVAPVILSVVAENKGDFSGFWSETARALGIGTGVTAILTVLWSQYGKKATTKVTKALGKHLPRLFGVLLLLLLITGALGVAGAAAVGDSAKKWFKIPAYVVHPWVFAAAFVIVLVAYLFLSANSPSLSQLYAKCLIRSFDGVSDDHQRPVTWRRVAPSGAEPQTPEAGTWEWLAANEEVPELILCCAQQRTGLSPGTLPAESFTISPTQVTCGSKERTLNNYLEDATDIRQFKFYRAYPRIEYVSTWLAVTGAAFSSAMGRQSLGSTNAALAACNADLGTWLPNPLRKVEPRPRPRIAYLAKEILGWYEDTDDFIFATDGGHWDNLGLVEQLRRGSTRIICIDASGDAPGKFTTLREAIALAHQEFDTRLARQEYISRLVIDDLDGQLAPISPPSNGSTIPASMAARISFRWESRSHPDPVPGVIYYAKLQVSTSMDPELAEYGARDKQFPGYSTFNQVLKNEQFERLFEAGAQAGREVAKLISADQTGPTPWIPDQQRSTQAKS